MKKQLLCFLAILSFSNFQQDILAQTLNFSAAPSSSCYVVGSTSIVANVNSVPSGATNFSWTILGPCSASVSSIANGSTANFSTSCCGMFTITCAAYNATISPPTPVLVGTPVTQTVILNCSPVVNASALNTTCAGYTASLTATGAVSYVWNNFATGGLIFVNPTVNTCYTVVGTAANGCTTSAVACTTVSPLPTLTVSGNSSICSGQNATLSASGANTYTWYNGTQTITSANLISGSAGCYTLVGLSAQGCPAMTASCISVVASPTVFAIGAPTVLCVGQTSTLMSAGATTYTWNTGTWGSSVVVSPSTSVCYSVVGQTGNCFGMAQVCIMVNAPPTLSVNSGTICAGNLFTLACWGGAVTYTWLPINMMTANPIVSPSSTTNYTVIASNGWGCTSSMVTTVSVTPNPTISITGTGPICPGGTATLTGFGATTYSWSTASTSQSITVQPVSNTCYTLSGTVNNCIDTAVYCQPVNAGPALNVTGASSVCLGTSATYTAAGAATYTWLPGGSNNGTLNVNPTANSVYTLNGSLGNGCSGSYTFALNVNSACSDVWPGDANSDGVVSNADVLELGLQFAATGAARTPGGNSYNAQYATNWTGTISTGKNKSHADCNGDGVVDNNDTLAIFNNFALTHAFKPGSPASAADISLNPANGTYNAGKWNKVDVMLGSNTSPMSQIYGVAFDLSFDQSMVVPDSAYLVYTSSFLNANTQNVQFRKPVFVNGKIYAATVRIDGNDVNGSGKIAEFRYKVPANANTNNVMNITVSNAMRVNSTGVNTGLTGGSSTFNLETNPVGIQTESKLNGISMYPNPAKDMFTIYTGIKNEIQYSVNDLSGRLVMTGIVIESQNIDIKQLNQGVYVVSLRSGDETAFIKLVVEK